MAQVYLATQMFIDHLADCGVTIWKPDQLSSLLAEFVLEVASEGGLS